MLPEFDRKWAEMGLTDKELKALQEELTINPTKGDVMQGTPEVCGKSGSPLMVEEKAAAQEFAMWTLRFMSVFI